MSKVKKFLSVVLVLVFVCGVAYLLYWLVAKIWVQFQNFDENISVAILKGGTTVIVATLTVVLGRYYERKRDIEAHFRSKKIEIYDEFLSEFFNIMGLGNATRDEEEITAFLKEWHRKIILWGGSDVLNAYITWNLYLKKGRQDAKSMWLLEDFMRAIRKDLGQSLKGLQKGSFLHLILRNSELFIAAATVNPGVTLGDLAILEKDLLEKQLQTNS